MLGSALWSMVQSLLLEKHRKHFYQAEEREVALVLGARESSLG